MVWTLQDSIFHTEIMNEQKMRMDMIKQIRDEEKVPVAILLDTKGPEIRTGVLDGGKKGYIGRREHLCIVYCRCGWKCTEGFYYIPWAY